jgi:hypothetical protein
MGDRMKSIARSPARVGVLAIVVFSIVIGAFVWTALKCIDLLIVTAFNS